MELKRVVEQQQQSDSTATLATELLQLLGEELPEMKQRINKYFIQKDWYGLNKIVHQLHAACCYCEIPALRKSARSLIKALKSEDTKNYSALTTRVMREIDLLMDSLQQK